jgi:hypothetical protein
VNDIPQAQLNGLFSSFSNNGSDTDLHQGNSAPFNLREGPVQPELNVVTQDVGSQVDFILT